MFASFFPRPKLFFSSAVLWAVAAVGLWYAGARDWGGAGPRTPIPSVSLFWSAPFLWFYLYYTVAVGLFAGFWMVWSPHRWARWSILGTALILFVTYFQVEVSVAINNWYGPFYNLIQAALSRSEPVSLPAFYGQLLTFSGIAFVAVGVGVLTRFFVSHYIFRWRTAMNEHYMARWDQVRRIEGAAQRVQEDTMRFSTTMEGLGVSLLDSIMTLIAFLPVLTRLSANVTVLPLVGRIPDPLVVAAILWSIFGTVVLALIGIRLPGLEFRNQRVEAAYRKELVHGEDDPERARPETARELFSHVRRNYFRLYLHFMYFNVGRIFYLQVDNIFPYLILAPTIIAGQITLGALNQILSAFAQVRSSLQYLVASWSTIVELISIYQRLRAFDAKVAEEPSSGEAPELPGLQRSVAGGSR